MVTAGPRTRRRDEEERIILMKSRGRRPLDFIRIILSFSSSPDFSTKNVRICDKYVSIWCHGGDHSKWSNFWFIVFWGGSVNSHWKMDPQQKLGPWRFKRWCHVVVARSDQSTRRSEREVPTSKCRWLHLKKVLFCFSWNFNFRTLQPN